MKTKTQKVKQVYCEVYEKESNQIDFDLLVTLLKEGRLSGYITKAGSLSDGNSFADLHLIIKEERNES